MKEDRKGTFFVCRSVFRKFNSSKEALVIRYAIDIPL